LYERGTPVGAGVEPPVAGRSGTRTRLLFFFITLKPKVEGCKLPCALNMSPPRNRFTFLGPLHILTLVGYLAPGTFRVQGAGCWV